MHDEGDGLWALHVGSMPQLLVAELEAALDLGALWDVTPSWGVPRRERLPGHRILFLDAPAELVHDPVGAPELAQSVLIDPHHAVGGERRLAAVLYKPEGDLEQGVIYTRDPDVLCQALVCWIGGVLEDLAGREPIPELDEAAVEALLEPLPQGSWRELSIARLGSSWTVELEGHGVDTRRWVGSRSGGWRTAWSW